MMRLVGDGAFVLGILLADTKFEFGVNAAGRLVVADEIFTPDCSRFWSAATYRPGRQQDSLDKQVCAPPSPPLTTLLSALSELFFHDNSAVDNAPHRDVRKHN